MSAASPGHEWVDHTSEMTLLVRAASLTELLAEATRAFLDLVPEDIRGPVRDERLELEIDAGDEAALLVDWLNELVYLAEAECWLPIDVDSISGAGPGVRVGCGAMALTAPFVLVKAATLYNARVREIPDGLEAEVTLDV